MIRISQLKLRVTHDERDLKDAVCKLLRINQDEIISLKLLRRSLDARKKPDIFYIYTLDVAVKKEDRVLKLNRNNKDIAKAEDKVYEFPRVNVPGDLKRPVIIGSGPAGLFAALMLAENGFKPIVYERGEAVEKRMESVKSFWQGGALKPDSNVQFGEGGAGTFSDGKLNTLVKDVSGRNKKVLEMFVEAGAPEDILYVNKPHIGTDILCKVVKNMRNRITECGGEIFFESKISDIIIENGRVRAVMVEDSDGNCQRTEADVVVLAVGHSARDTFKMLYDRGIFMEPKAFAAGVRIQHPQEMINISQYGEDYPDVLGAADYKLTYQASNGRSVYSFCMCPGGYVVNASSEKGRLAINGMSYRDRGSLSANSALIVNVTPEDFGGAAPLSGVEFQRRLEENAYRAANGRIPAIRLGEFFKEQEARRSEGELISSKCSEGCDQPKDSDFLDVTSGQFKGLYADEGSLGSILPDYMCEALYEAIKYFGTRIKGFDRPDALISAVESRTSSPVRIARDEYFESNIKGLYPCGEGAGYAGGITSAAMDGIKVAEAIAKKV